MQPYIYEPLPTARSVRLLKLHGDSEPPIRDDRIRCTLRVVSLDDCPTYSAISYTWGDALVTHVIECDGKEIHTRPNLHRLLQEICRSEYRDHELWIDAICINQSCLDERAHQVRLMKSIYSNSTVALVYLGEPMEEGHLALELCRQIIEMTTKFKAGYRITESNLEDYGLPPIESPCWSALYDLFSQPWFQRVWIMQEYMLSPKVLMLYGGVWSPSEFYVSIDNAFLPPRNDGYGLGMVLSGLRKQDPGQVWNVNSQFRRHFNLSWMDASRRLLITKREVIIHHLFNRSRQIQATDPRDYIYGILGLLKESEANHPDLQPDYHLTVSQTFIMTARYLLSKEGLAYLFEISGLPKSIDSLPSWVPDWTKSKVMSDIDGVKCNFSAGGNMKAAWRLSAGQAPDKLIVNGTILDTIKEIHTLFGYGALPWNEAIVKFFFSTSELVKRSAMAAIGLDVAESHIRTLTFGQSSAVLSSSEFSSISAIIEPLYHDDRILNASTEERDQISNCIARIEVQSGFLNFCLTERGSIGRIPHDARIGDKVCFFPGIATPFIIRSHQQRAHEYVLIGKCYIDGKMCGEVFQGMDVDVQEISLV
jgi:hypothetical protein